MRLIEAAKNFLGIGEKGREQSHLVYDSLEAWAAGVGLPADWTMNPDQAQRDVWWKQFAELKQHLWQKHLSTLTHEEQQQFKDGTHPSLRHEYADRALPFCKLLEADLAKGGLAAVVKIGYYHMNRIVLSAYLSELPAGGLPGSPWLFRGFEVKAVRASEPIDSDR
jgi:hypothetical protein